MTIYMDKIDLQPRRWVSCQVRRFSTATVTDNISQMKGQPNTQMHLLENYILELSIWVSQLPSLPHGAYGVGSDTGPDRRGWAPWNKTITRVKKEVESQACNKIAWSCQYSVKSMKPYFRPPDIMRTAGFPSLVCATRSVVPNSLQSRRL